ncbi:MAG TPA: sulfotransferase domain-containing protein [Solirubrobacterales bacterium]
MTALPTFFIIGAAKAGTTSLHHYLNQHPEIQMSAIKEPNFFSGPANGVPYPVGRVSRLDQYERLFDPAYEVRGEASPGYSTHPRRQGVPQRIKGLLPEAKLVYVVRDPIARAVSQYQMRVGLGGEDRPPNEALTDLSDPRVSYIPPGLYATQLELYLRHFRQDRILVIDQADLLGNRRPTLQQVFDFLSVDDAIDSSGFNDELMSSQQWRAYSPRYRSFRRVVAPALRWLPQNFRQSIRGSVERSLWPPLEKPEIDDGLHARLEAFYAEDMERFRALTGKKFPSWSI